MKTLNWISKKAKLKLQNPFTFYGYMETEVASGKNVAYSNQKLQMGFNNIRTLHQFEALLFWLYSFCLLGLDGRDICELSEERIITEGYKKGDLRDYIPDADILGNEDYSKPIHVHLKRGKTQMGGKDSGVDAIFQINLFPTLVVLELLKHVMKHNNKDYAYTGNDQLKIFNFDINTEEGYKKWESIRKSYSQELGKKLGTSTQQTRHTVAEAGQKIGLSKEEIDSLLNHKTKGVIKHYTKKQQTQDDVSHIHIFQQFDLLEVVRNLLSYFENKKQLVDNIVVPFIGEDIMTQLVYASEGVIMKKRRVPRMHRKQILYDIGKLTKFSREDEVKYQTLLKEVLEGKPQFVDGKMVLVAIKKEEYPKELQQLIEKRKGLYEVKPKFKQELLDKIDFVEALEDVDPKVVPIKKVGS